MSKNPLLTLEMENRQKKEAVWIKINNSRPLSLF
jgi:hypothetical protein